MNYILKNHIITKVLLLLLFLNYSLVFGSKNINKIICFVNISCDTVPNKDLKYRDSCQIIIDSLKASRIKNTQFETAIINLKTENERLKNNNTEISENLRSYFGVNGNKAYRVKYKLYNFDCYEVDLSKSKISFYLKDEQGKEISSLNNLNKLITRKNEFLVFATNGGMYTKDQNPQGLFIQNRKTIVKIDKRIGLYGNFYLQPNGVFYIDTCNFAGIISTANFTEELNKSLDFATQSGPLLVYENKYNSNFKEGSDNVNIRSGVGINENGKLVFVISNERINFYDFASLFKEKLKCPNALYLDGAISETFLPEIGRFQLGGNFGPMIAITKNE